MSNPSEDFVSFEKALRDLKLQSEELKKLVSEGEIRAFREGGSMKFRREDVAALASKRTGESELVFADQLEDDTGMVTEELSEEDTLLAEEEAVESKPARATAAAAPRVRRMPQPAAEPTGTPGWVTFCAVATSVALIYGAMIAYQVTFGIVPSGLTGWCAPQ